MYFGEVAFDGFVFSEFIFRVLLFQQNDTWLAKVKLSPPLLYDSNPEPDVDMFVSELQSALKAHLDFDFGKYWNDWEKVDPHFKGFVLDSSKDPWLE